ncbi:MAG: carboxypeptidase-like regulatory domain-containing protein, partial [Planctomycetota bacterium]
PKGPWITGRAVDPYGNAVKNAWITVSPWSQMAQTLAFEQMGMASSSSEAPRNSVATDAEGRFKIHRRKNLGAEIAVTARGIGFLVTRDRRVMTTGDREDVELEDLVLDPGVVLRGSVVNHLGEPVAGARVKRGKGTEGPLAVAAEVLEEMGMSGGGGVETDADGVFELPYEEAGLYTLTASHEEYPSVSASG